MEDLRQGRAGEVWSARELEGMKQICPDAWWQLLRKRCPGCGKDGRRVGGSFQPPPKHDKKTWAHIAQMLRDGGKFDSCRGAAIEAEKERRRVQASNWVARDMHKRMIITKLEDARRSADHTGEEKQKIQNIRDLKATNYKSNQRTQHCNVAIEEFEKL